MSSKFKKIVYWDRSYRIVKAEQVPIIEQKIVEKKPFRLHHSAGVDLVQPGTISLITDPKYEELPREPKPLAIEAGKNTEPSLPAEITALIRRGIVSDTKEERKWWLDQFKVATRKWRESGKIEVPNSYKEGERNG